MVQYAPKILSFSAVVSNNNYITLTCHAEGLPKPTYTIFPDEREANGGQNGIVIIRNYSLYDNMTYTCISRNNLGHDIQHFSPNSLKDVPYAQTACQQTVTLIENDTFSCLCTAISTHFPPTATWIKDGRFLGEPNIGEKRLFLRNVSKDASGTYICRAQLHTLIGEKSVEIIVQYAPRILSFSAVVSNNYSITLTCRAEGLPKPTYTIYSNEGETIGGQNGIVQLPNYNLVDNVTYTCISRNNLGYDTQHVFPNSFKNVPYAQTTCKETVTLKENDEFSCFCTSVTAFFSSTATWVKHGRPLSKPSIGEKKLFLRKVAKNESGTYICRAQFHTLIGERSVEIMVQYAPRILAFYGYVSKNNSITLTCIAEGLPKPSYAILSDKKEIKGTENGILIIHSYHLNDNVEYKCISRNNLGHDTQDFSSSLLSAVTSQSKKTQKSTSTTKKDASWYFILASAIAGFVFGILLVYGVQYLCRKKRKENEQEPQGAANPSYDRQDDPTPSAEVVYEEIDLKKLNKEENKYQNLRYASRLET